MVTDRPGFTEPTNLVSPGTVQIEYGFQFEQGRQGERINTAGVPILRIGISKHWEVRVGSEGYVAANGRGRNYISPQMGMSDISVGAKIGLLGEGRWRPALSILPSLSLPTGRSVFSRGASEPKLDLSWSKMMPGGFNVGGNMIGAARRGKDGGLESAVSLSVAHELPKGFGVYSEYYRIRPAGGIGQPNGVANGGFTYLLSTNVQVDVEAGWGVRGPGPRLFLAGGVVIRKPKALKWMPRLRSGD